MMAGTLTGLARINQYATGRKSCGSGLFRFLGAHQALWFYRAGLRHFLCRRRRGRKGKAFAHAYLCAGSMCASKACTPSALARLAAQQALSHSQRAQEGAGHVHRSGDVVDLMSHMLDLVADFAEAGMDVLHIAGDAFQTCLQ